MSAYSQQQRLYSALAASLLMHATLLGISDMARLFSVQPGKTTLPALQARLVPAVKESALLKNTLPEAEGPLLALPAQPAARPARVLPQPSRQRQAERKLVEHLFYPPEAIARGLEGEVRLLLTLAADGQVLDVRIASSSGHDVLDQAAAKAANIMRRLPDTGVRELILPVEFKLQ